MRLQWVLLGAFAATASAKHGLKRQNDSDDGPNISMTSSSNPPPTNTNTGGEDTTITTTTTITGDASTTTTTIVKSSTRTTTIIDTSTVFETVTVTSKGQATATDTVYVTETVFRNAKRWYDPAPRVFPVFAPAFPTPTAAAVYVENGEARPGRDIFKRAIITITKTVTASAGPPVTVTATSTRIAVTTTSSKSLLTSTITETEQADASTTITVTSTLTVTSAIINTNIVTQTGSTSPPTETGATGGGGDSEDSGLSAGAKAGIGAAGGAIGLALVFGLIWFCAKKKATPKYNHNENFGAPEFPIVGPSGGGHGATLPDMSNVPATGTGYAPATGTAYVPSGRGQANLPAEGYRGTAMGDGRAGYAKPEPYGAAYAMQTATHAPTNTPSPISPIAYTSPTVSTYTSMHTGAADKLPEHSSPTDMDHSPYRPPTAELGHDGGAAKWQNPGAAEMDSTPVAAPLPKEVYEMPAQHYHRE